MLDWVDGLDLRSVHAIATLLGAILPIYVAQLWGRGELTKIEPPVFMHTRRWGLIALALGNVWSLLYSDQKGWQPWPPHLAIIIAIDVMLVSTVLSAAIRRWRETHGHPVANT